MYRKIKIPLQIYTKVSTHIKIHMQREENTHIKKWMQRCTHTNMHTHTHTPIYTRTKRLFMQIHKEIFTSKQTQMNTGKVMLIIGMEHVMLKNIKKAIT